MSANADPDGGAGRSAPPAEARSWAVAATILTIAATAVSVAASRGDRFAFDEPVTRWVQSPGGVGLDRFAVAVSWAGLRGPMFVAMLMLAAFVWWRGDRVGAAVLAGASALRPFNVLVKELVSRPRPEDDVVRVLHQSSSHGFPSGHVFGATLLALLAAGVLGRVTTGWPLRLAQWVAVLFAFMMGWARIRTGAHWPGDVLGGWLWGAALASWVMAALPLLDARFPRRHGGVRQ